jgi:23S rRNA (uracil1939-C5)-methyltransferase
LTIEKPAAGGRMIARHEGQVVLVAGAIPGERVRARVERTSRSVAYAEITALDEPSPDRRAWAGDPACGGCLYAHIAYSRQLQIKAAVVADAFAHIGRITLPTDVPVEPSPEEGYRMRARLHVRGLRLGLFREGTHDLCDARQTKQFLAATCDVLDRVGAAIRSLGVDSVREIDLAENADASARAIAIETTAPIAATILEQVGSAGALTGVVCGRRTVGDPHVVDTITVEGGPSISLRRHVLAFFQGNRFLLPRLVSHVLGEIPEHAEVVDLYAGGGLFSIAAARARSARVTAVEGDFVAAADLAANAAGASGVTAVHESVETFLSRGVGPLAQDAVALVDPPRTGMSKEAADGLVRLGASRIVYVSCDVATLARDARRLVDAGYRVATTRAFDLFPNTPHVETVVAFTR